MSTADYSPAALEAFARDYANVEWLIHISGPSHDRLITADNYGEPLAAVTAFEWAHRTNTLSTASYPVAATVFHFGKPANQGGWLVYSWEHGAWWKPGGWGYTGELTEAGRYTQDEARGICQRAAYGWHGGNPPEVMIPADAEDYRAAIQAATDAAIAGRENGDQPLPEPIRVEVTLRKAGEQ